MYMYVRMFSVTFYHNFDCPTKYRLPDKKRSREQIVKVAKD
jgi:hypothetical protein